MGCQRVKVLVFGTTPPCARCLEAERIARQAAENFPSGCVVVEKHDALSQAGRHFQIAVTPTIVVNEKKVAVGKVPSEAELVEIIGKELEG